MERSATCRQLHNEACQRTRTKANKAIPRDRKTLQRRLHVSENERRLIAYEIHDGLAQYLAASILLFQAFQSYEDQDAGAAAGAFERGMALLQESDFHGLLIKGECEGLGPIQAAQKFGFSKQRYFPLRAAFAEADAQALQSQKRGPSDGLALTDGRGQRFLDEHRQAGFQTLQGQIVVRVIGRCYQDAIDLFSNFGELRGNQRLNTFGATAKSSTSRSVGPVGTRVSMRSFVPSPPMRN